LKYSLQNSKGLLNAYFFLSFYVVVALALMKTGNLLNNQCDIYTMSGTDRK